MLKKSKKSQLNKSLIFIIILIFSTIILFFVFSGFKLSNLIINKDSKPIINRTVFKNIPPPEEYNEYLDAVVLVTYPFSASSWNIRTEGITIILGNAGADKLTIKKIQITNCGIKDFDIFLYGSEESFFIPCSLDLNSNFRGDITISYVKKESNMVASATGRISGKVL
jgi:hypothetical protein